ncbi:30S ribosomal protein S21 [bacterium]|nr:30S ribosomal protein S21 [bacterium]
MRIIALRRYSFASLINYKINRNGGDIVLEVRRKDGESFESLIRRFTRKTIQSGKILQAKKIRFFSKSKTKRELRESALRKKGISSKLDYLKQIGKLDEFELKRRHKKR